MKSMMAFLFLVICAQNVKASNLKSSSELRADGGFYWGVKLSVDGSGEAHTNYKIQLFSHMSVAPEQRAKKTAFFTRMLDESNIPVDCQNAKSEDEVFMITGSTPGLLEGGLVNWFGGNRSFALCVYTESGKLLAELKDVIETQPN